MNTLRDHLREMLDSIDEQLKIPNTKLHGGCWMDYDGVKCTLCAAGAWYAQKFGRRNIVDISHNTGPVAESMRIMNSLRILEVRQAHERLYGRATILRVPYYIYQGNAQTMDVAWRASMEDLLIWLTEQNL